MRRACVLLANGFEEIEAITIIDVLRRAKIEVELLAVGALQVAGAHGIEVRADRLLDAAAHETFDAVVLPGGMPGAATLRDNVHVQALIKRHHAQGHLVAAICAAPIALGKAGLLEGKEATCFPGFEAELLGARLRLRPVVKDGQVITSRGPGTAMSFALALVAELGSEKLAATLAEQMLVGGG